MYATCAWKQSARSLVVSDSQMAHEFRNDNMNSYQFHYKP